MQQETKEALLAELLRKPVLAHAILFPHRHPHVTPGFHKALITAWHSSARNVITCAFRGAAKSTIAEETIIIKACFRQFKNALIVGESHDRAVDRLRSIKRELEINEELHGLFGDLVGPTWQEAKIVLPSGVVIQAVGQGQAIRGTKHFDARPDFLFVDDLESKESVATPEARTKLSSWVYSDLFPAMDPRAVRRVAGTPLAPEAWLVGLLNNKEWTKGIYPIEYVDDDGERRAMWPDRFSLADIDRLKHEYFTAHKTTEWEQEFMCRAVDPATRVFLPEHIRVEPVTRTWHPVIAAYDPARTINKTSASTGRVVGSWIGNKLVLWEAGAHMWLPDAITEDIFRVDEEYAPLLIGVEQDGLHEFLTQPLRSEMTKRGKLIPLEPLKAPKSKLDFIKKLQPFFKAREVIFAGTHPEPFQDMIDQLMSFPGGRIDAPNALAYLLTLRPGLPVYEDFSQDNIAPDLNIMHRSPLYLTINADFGCTAAVLVELVSGQIIVHGDWLREGDPGTALPGIMLEARPLAGRSFTCYAPKARFEYDKSGLVAAMRKEQTELRRGGECTDGREVIRSALGRTVRGAPALRVASRAEWTLKALAGGYARKAGAILPAEGVYRALMEGLESFLATTRYGVDNDSDVRYETGSDGRRYISARATDGGLDETKFTEEQLNRMLSGRDVGRRA